MVSIDEELNAIKINPLRGLNRQRIIQLCNEAGYRPEADGPLEPATLLALFMRQIALGNISCDGVRLLGNDRFSASAYCQARMRLPLPVIQTLTRELCLQLGERADQDEWHRWHNHRVLLMDSTSFSMPDCAELKSHFGQSGAQKDGCGFPIAHLLLVFNARTGLAVDAITAPLRTHEMSLACDTHGQMARGDLVLGDDSFGTYAHLAMLQRRGVHGLFPVHHMRLVDFTPHRPCIEPRHAAKDGKGRGLPRSRWMRSLGEQDQLVQWFKPRQKPAWMSQSQWKQLPDTLLLRELRRTVRRPGFRPVTLTIVTTLIDPLAYPPAELLALRLRRWDVETDLRHLKTTMGMQVLNCKTVAGGNSKGTSLFD